MSDELDKLDENFGLIPNLEYVANDLPSTDFYVSKPGFEVVPLLRGFDEIRKLWKILEAIKEEVGDLMWYVAILCDELKLSFEEIWEMNIKKLKIRYPNLAFQTSSALDRDLEAEKKVFEQ